MARLFLLDGTSPGRVRISGAAISGQVRGSGPPFATQWLGGCSSYRRSVLLDERFDARLDGYSLDEDLDLSFRVARRGTLLVVPDALIVHHESKQGRATPADYARDHLIHRYWFIEKNLDHPLKKTAFWWSTIGRLLAARSGTDARRKETFEGLVEGVRIVWNRDHPLLSPYP